LRNLSTFRELRTRRQSPFKWLLAGLALIFVFSRAQAGESSKAISQYVREHWGTLRGFPSGPVYGIAQTNDGYLWIGTSKGLIRFDGLQFQLFQQSNDATAPNGPVLGLLTDSDGNLWIRLQSAVLLRYRDGKFQDLSNTFETPEVAVTAMARGADGRPLFSGIVNGIVRYKAGGFVSLAPAPKMPDFIVISIAEMSDGRILLGTRDTGLYQLAGGQLAEAPMALHDRKINCLLAFDQQKFWIGTDNGLLLWNGKKLVTTSIPPSLLHAQILAINKDRESNTWIGTADGLFRISSVGISSHEKEPPHTGFLRAGGVTAIFEDREGDIWNGSTDGLERLRDGAFTTYSLPEGLPSENNGPVYVDSENRTWFAPAQGGLYWMKDGVVESVKLDGLDKDVIYSISGEGIGDLWIGRQRGGLTHLNYSGGKFNADTYTQSQGLAQNSVYAIHRNRDGAIWAATLTAGVSKLKDGKFSNYTTQNGLLSNSVVAIAQSDADGTMWFATPKGLNALSNGIWHSFTQKDGLPSEDVICLLQDSTGVLWLGTARGLAAIRSEAVWEPEEVPASLREPIFGIEADRIGGLWIATANRVLRVDRSKLLSGNLSSDDVREYGLSDGLRGTEGIKRNSSVVADHLGRIWFSLNNGISFVDPARAVASTVPALVHIQGISVDGIPIDLAKDIRVPNPHRRVTFTFEGLSLAAPDHVRYKYRLDGFDRDWSEPFAEREVSYTNLDSGPYRFHVMASNSDGEWNGAESNVQFNINPVFWQTTWFRLSALLAFALAVALIVRLRMLRIQKQMAIRFEERLAERTRIAQELHDTLLQGFLSASMQLHVADELLAAESPAKPMVQRVLTLMGKVIEEGRNVVRGLRSSSHRFQDLEQAFSGIQRELGDQPDAGFRVVVDGTSRPLRPAIRDQVYAIGREALVNAFRHARASEIEVELEYASSHLRVLVRDNGCGIDPGIIHAGREGHWGLSGMRERAESIGARLRVLSALSAGTEVEFTIPGSIAYEGTTSDGLSGWFLSFRAPQSSENEVQSERQK
jgi:signal transduction histidine kinase/ligand-binding sensor domain-containing protein